MPSPPTTPSPDAIVLQDVCKTFPSKTPIPPALSKINAHIKRGHITGIVGPDGAGKTTLMRIMAGLLLPTSGTLSISSGATLGYMPQKFGLYEDLTVIENLNLYADLRGVLGDERIAAFEQLLQFTDLTRFTTRPAGKLSGGMKQKLGLACVLLGRPDILLLDEPSVGVDPISRRELWKMVNALITEGMTVLWSTSYLDEAEQCDDVLLMNAGELIYAGPPKLLTDKIAGRSIQIREITENHRQVLQRALHAEEVMDGVIQGKNVRLLLKDEKKLPDLSALHAGENAELVQVPPRFEDAFIDILGGGPGGDSVLANLMAPIEKTMQCDHVITAENLTKKFGTFVAVDDISFAVKRGEVFGLLGPNGAGKSTTFKMMCGLLAPTSGSAHLLGIDLQKSAHLARQQLGYMAQKFSLYGDLSVQQNLQFFSGIYGLTGKAQADKIAEMVDVFELASLLQMKAAELSLGFKQRLALACAIMHEPAILFLDEPTSGVDPITRREFWMHINGLVGKGMTIVVSTHFMEEAEYCDRVALVYRGQVIETGTPDQLKALVTHEKNPDPSMEDTFIDLIEQHDANNNDETITPPNTNKIIKQSAHSLSFINKNDGLRRWVALCRKEFYQIVRDPSSILIAFVLPIVMLFIYGFGLNLDSSKIRLGIVMEDTSTEARHLEDAFFDSPFIAATHFNSRSDAKKELTAGNIRGFVAIQSDFSARLKNHHRIAPIQVIADGSETNTASFVAAYATGVWQTWMQSRSHIKPELISVEPRVWFNAGAISRYFLIPGSIAIIMTVIGALLTSLVVAREWERGTMEALLSTPVKRMELFFSKLVPYYLLGIGSMGLCLLISMTILSVPFRGSIFLLFIQTSLFLGGALGLGLLLSTTTRNQFNAAQAALNIAFLPAVMLSGFVYEISSMPIVVQGFTYIFPARYFVASLQTLFLSGNVGMLLLQDALFLLISALVFLGLAAKLTRRRLE